MALVSQPGPRNIQHIKTGAKRNQNCRKEISKQVKRNIKTYENKIIEDEYSTGDQIIILGVEIFLDHRLSKTKEHPLPCRALPFCLSFFLFLGLSVLSSSSLSVFLSVTQLEWHREWNFEENFTDNWNTILHQCSVHILLAKPYMLIHLTFTCDARSIFFRKVVTFVNRILKQGKKPDLF